MGKNKNPDYSQKCKCCLMEEGLKNLWNEYNTDGEREIYGDMLTECFALTWEQPLGKTIEYICDSCVSRLRDAITFKREILYTEKILSEQIKDEPKHNIKEEEESNYEFDTEYHNIEYLETENADADKTLEINIESGQPQSTNKEELLSSSRRRRYTEEDLMKCIEAVKSKTLSQTKASILYRVPRKIISAAIARQSANTRKTLTKHFETTLNITDEVNTGHCQINVPEIKFKMFPEFENFGSDIGTLLDCSNATPIRCRGGIGYKCCFCPQQYPDAAELKKHTSEIHDSKTKSSLIKGKYTASYLVKLDITCLRCTICNHELNTLEYLIDHLIGIHGKNVHRNIKNHILPFKFQGEALRCVICYSLFNKFKVLQEHMSSHFRNYVCDYCDSGFVTRTILLNHMKGHELGSFKCDHCTKTYNTLRKKRAHERIVHIHGSMLNKCGYCNEKFSRYQKKEEHLVRMHGVRSVDFVCQACDKTFVSQRALRDHTKRDHLLERQHKCSECDMSFFRESEVRKHMVKHTGVRKYQCEVCQKSYGRKNTLREHLRIHAGDRRFRCEHCGQTFVQKCSWRGHVRTKHGEHV